MITKTWVHWGQFAYVDAEFCENMGCRIHIEHETKELGNGFKVCTRVWVKITSNTAHQELLLVLKYGTDLSLLETTYHEENY